MAIGDLYLVIGSMWFMFLCAAIVVPAIFVFVVIRNSYVYRADRPGFFPESFEKSFDYLNNKDSRKSSRD